MLTRESDGYYRVRWADMTGRRHCKAFGRSARDARARYAAWLDAQGGVAPASMGLPVRDAVGLFLDHARQYYEPASHEPIAYEAALRDVRARQGDRDANHYRPEDLEQARDWMVDRGLLVSTCNNYVRRIRHVWKWFASKGYVSPATWWGLRTIRPLVAGQCAAATPRPIQPAPEAAVEATLAEAPEALRALIGLQLATGCRPGEACRIREADVRDRDRPVWIYSPAIHKNARRGRILDVLLGPRAQRILAPRFLEYDRESPVFWTRSGRPYNTKRYSEHVRRIHRAHGIEHWHPHQLRHNAATSLRDEFGLDVAQAVLGHAKLDTTQIYAALNRRKALAAVAKTG